MTVCNCRRSDSLSGYASGEVTNGILSGLLSIERGEKLKLFGFSASFISYFGVIMSLVLIMFGNKLKILQKSIPKMSFWVMLGMTTRRIGLIWV